MQLLIDTDIFWKLAMCNLLEDAVNQFGVDLDSCCRLPALKHMLRRGGLRQRLGEELCESLIPKVMAMPIITATDADLLDKLSQLPEVDPGEALIYAAAVANASVIVLSSDKRALTALKCFPNYLVALSGRIVIFEAILLALCDCLGVDEVRGRIRPLLSCDAMVRVCFSPGNPDPRAALLSYYDDIAVALDPLVLWRN